MKIKPVFVRQAVTLPGRPGGVSRREGRRRVSSVAVGLGVALGAVALLPATAAAQGAYPVDTGELQVSDTTVVPGGAVTIIGGGFEPGTSVAVTFRSDPIRLATTTSDSNGRIEVTVRIPTNASPGMHTLEARGTDAGGGTLVLSQEIEVLGAQTGGPLPLTGLPIMLVVLIGTSVLATGLLLRRRSRRGRPAL